MRNESGLYLKCERTLPLPAYKYRLFYGFGMMTDFQAV